MARSGSAAIVIALIATPALAQEKPPIVARAELCLRSNVDRVVAAEPNVDSAANFLLTYICAGEVSDAARYELNIIVVKQFGAMGATFPQSRVGTSPVVAAAPSASVDPETGDIVVPPQKSGQGPDIFTPMLRQMGSSTGQFTQMMMPVSLRKLAGSLVLEARERQLAKPR
jgi:hypothetical protein